MEIKSATATASPTRSSSGRRSTGESSSATLSTTCYPLFRSLSRSGVTSKTRNSNENEDDLQESSSDEDEVSLASLASLAGSAGNRRKSRIHADESESSTKNRRHDTSSTKRRKLVESTGGSRSSSLDDSSAAHTNQDATNNAGRRRKQQQRRQLGIGAFLSASSSRERTTNSGIETTSIALGTSTNPASSDRTDTETNDDGGNSTAVAASNACDKLRGGSDPPTGMTQKDTPGALAKNGSTESDDSVAFDEAHKQQLNAMQFGMQFCAAPASSSSTGRIGINVLSELFRRSIFPVDYVRGGSSPSKPLRRFANAPDKWTKCETVRLPGRHSTVALEFDRQGVLLALGDTRGMITVYDFDELCAADMAVRRAVCRQQGAVAASAAASFADADADAVHTNNRHCRRTPICPVLAFGTRSTARISCIKWDPNSEDLLVVSFLTDCRVNIYDLNSGSEAESPNFIVLSDADSLRGQLRTEGNISTHHLPPSNRKVHQLLTGGAYGTIRLWNFPTTIAPAREGDVSRRRKKNQVPTLAWSMSPFSSSSHLSADSEGVSSICHLENSSYSHRNSQDNGSGLILVGGSKGSLAIIDQDRRSKKAFSTKLTPTILWSSNIVRHITRRRLVDGVLPSNSWMGIKKIVLWGDASSSGAGRNFPTVRSTTVPFEEARLTIVTNCGWALNASIRGLGRTSRNLSDFPGEPSVAFSLQIAHKTARTTWLNSDLEEIIVGENASTFSLPLSPPPVCALPGQSTLLAIASVKNNVMVMSNKDKRVLSSLPDAEIERLCQDGGDAILLVDTSMDRVAVSEQQGKLGSDHSSIVSRIPLGNGTPQTLAVHPGGQWMIVGCSGEGREELTLFCQRSKT